MPRLFLLFELFCDVPISRAQTYIKNHCKNKCERLRNERREPDILRIYLGRHKKCERDKKNRAENIYQNRILRHDKRNANRGYQDIETRNEERISKLHHRRHGITYVLRIFTEEKPENIARINMENHKEKYCVCHNHYERIFKYLLARLEILLTVIETQKWLDALCDSGKHHKNQLIQIRND